MGKIIKDGFAFMKYVSSGLIRKIDDTPELKDTLIELGEGDDFETDTASGFFRLP